MQESVINLFMQMLNIDSSSGREEEFAQWCIDHLDAPNKELLHLEDGQLAVMLSWSDKPKLVFCSHLDTVPPYILPSLHYGGEDHRLTQISGRGSCDAKGQIFSMYLACKRLEAMGKEDFALLLLSGEETGSKGAKAFSKTGFEAKYLVIGEPTDNYMVSASKGTHSYELIFHGKACHSGYPEFGRNAIDAFVRFYNDLSSASFDIDPIMGETIWNVGQLHSPNPQNIISDELSCRLYFRTTCASAQQVSEWMQLRQSEWLTIIDQGGDTPAYCHIVEGLPAKAVSFGSDAPHLSGFSKKMICGPGSIMTAHREEENIDIDAIKIAIDNYIKIYEDCD